MTERQCTAMLREEILPVILGDGKRARRLSLTLRLRYGLTALHCSPRQTLWDRLTPFSFYYPLIKSDSELLSQQLIHLSLRYEGCLLLLIPATDEELQRLLPIRSSLEAEYILATPDTLWDKLPASLRRW